MYSAMARPHSAGDTDSSSSTLMETRPTPKAWRDRPRPLSKPLPRATFRGTTVLELPLELCLPASHSASTRFPLRQSGRTCSNGTSTFSMNCRAIPLHLACFFGQLEAAETLVQHGADANAVSPSRIAVIHSAAASRNAALLKLV